jgi:hypothetical protein
VSIRTALALLFVAAGLAGLAAPASASAQPPCWQTLIEDWTDGAISNLYPIRCYRQALRRMPEDVRLYSNASDDIGRALADRVISAHRTVSASASPAATTGAAVAAAPTRDGNGLSAPLRVAGRLVALVTSLGLAALLVRRIRSSARTR